MTDVTRETRIAAPVEIEQPQAIIWDVDGVLIDSEPLHYEAVSNALSRSGIFLSEAENTMLLGRSLPQVWLYLNERGLQDDCETWTHKVEDYYMSRVDAALARPEMRRLVAELFRRGIPPSLRVHRRTASPRREPVGAGHHQDDSAYRGARGRRAHEAESRAVCTRVPASRRAPVRMSGH